MRARFYSPDVGRFLTRDSYLPSAYASLAVLTQNKDPYTAFHEMAQINIVKYLYTHRCSWGKP